MTNNQTQRKMSGNSRAWRRRVGALLLISGYVLLLGTLLARVKIILAAHLQTDRTFLVSKASLDMYLPPKPEPSPLITTVPLPEPAPAVVEPTQPEPSFSLETPPKGAPSLTIDKPLKPESAPPNVTVFFPLVYVSPIDVNETPPDEDYGQSPVDRPPDPGAGPVIRLVVPSLNIDRAVIPVGLKQNGGNQLTWNTDVLFSTNNRSDLVGQANTSVNPGEGGNIILIGHNYNNGWVSPAGVFINLQKLQTGSQILVYTRDGSEFRYEVRQVKKVPWRQQNETELEKHHKYLWPTEKEQLTLVTCGGANFGVWSARIYVVATPNNTPGNQ
jgi:LPXTG-site transpeptidase (sortase) family protein